MSGSELMLMLLLIQQDCKEKIGAVDMLMVTALLATTAYIISAYVNWFHDNHKIIALFYLLAAFLNIGALAEYVGWI